MRQALKQEKPHYHGHRERVRQKFVEHGPDSFADYELLELVLFNVIPLKDTKPLAKTLIAKFGSLPEVMSAPIEELIKIEGIKENTAIALKSIAALAHRALKAEIMNRPILNSWGRLLDYCHAAMAHETREHLRVLFLSKKNELIADEIQNSGTVDAVSAHSREIVKRALELGATALILVHNHPSGDPKPSKDDIEMTEQIVYAAEPFKIIIHDHIIISRKSYSSFKSLGLL